MSVPEILKTIGERFQSSATVKNVYGDAISVGDRTVIPVARLSYGFGGGGGNAGQDGKGGGGGDCPEDSNFVTSPTVRAPDF